MLFSWRDRGHGCGTDRALKNRVDFGQRKSKPAGLYKFFTIRKGLLQMSKEIKTEFEVEFNPEDFKLRYPAEYLTVASQIIELFPEHFNRLDALRSLELAITCIKPRQLKTEEIIAMSEVPPWRG